MRNVCQERISDVRAMLAGSDDYLAFDEEKEKEIMKIESEKLQRVNDLQYK